MHCLFIRSFLALMCTTVLCVGTVSATGQTSRENLSSERLDNLVAGMTDSLLGTQVNSYNREDPYLSRIHKDAYYHVVGISGAGDILQLHDASQWSVNPKHIRISLDWVQNDDIFIKPQAAWFSNYKYVLHNLTTQQVVEVNLLESPLPRGAHTFRIVNIEPYARLVQLSDNTIWQVDAGDYNFPYWQIGQRLLIGVNNNWRDVLLPHVLINVDIYKQPYSQADFYGYPAGY